MKQIAIEFPCGDRIFFASDEYRNDFTPKKAIAFGLRCARSKHENFDNAHITVQFVLYILLEYTNTKESILSPTPINDKRIQETIVVECNAQKVSFISHALSIWAEHKPDLTFDEFIEKYDPE